MDEMLIRSLLKALVMPPLGNILGVVLALVVFRQKPVLRTLLISVSLISLLLLSLPVVSQYLSAHLERYPAIDLQNVNANDYQAIVVLGSGRYRSAPEYGGVDTAKPMGLVRLRYGAHLQRATQLPILVTGGAWLDDAVPESDFMAAVLAEEFFASVRWRERKSRTTWENAVFSRQLTKEEGIDRILLVTHAWHMPRAVYSFEQAGFEVTPAPTMFKSASMLSRGVMDYVPNIDSLRTSTWMLHEILGMLWYRLASD